MKHLFALLFLLVWSLTSNGQHWKELRQPPINLKYKIPQNWYVGGFTQGKACVCTGGAINTANDRSLNMVIFSSNLEEIHIDSLKNQKIWGYSFAPTSMEVETLKTNHFEFKKALSTWNEDKDSAVLRFTASSNGFIYVVYFWGELNDVTKKAETIESILESLQVI